MTAILTNANTEAAGYTVSYESPSESGFRSIGQVEANEDFAINVIKRLEMFTASQLGEGTYVDGIYIGQGCLASMVIQEINTPAALGLVYPESQIAVSPPSTSAGGVPGVIGTVGALVSQLAGTLRFTPYYSALPVFKVDSNDIIEMPGNFWVEDGEQIRRQLHAGRHTIPLTLRVFAFLDEDDSNVPKLFRYV